MDSGLLKFIYAIQIKLNGTFLTVRLLDEQFCSQTCLFAVRFDIMLLISKIEMSVINKMANVFVVNFITGEPWYLAK